MVTRRDLWAFFLVEDEIVFLKKVAGRPSNLTVISCIVYAYTITHYSRLEDL